MSLKMTKMTRKIFALAAMGATSLMLSWGGAGGCGSAATTTSTPGSTTGAQSNTSGGMATLTTSSGATLGIVPNGTTIGVVTLDGTAPSALTTGFKSATLTSLTTTFEVSSCSADPIGTGTSASPSPRVVCVQGSVFTTPSSKVAIIDASTIVTTGTAPSSVIEVDLASATPAPTDGSFSGGGCTNCGVITDPGNGRFIVSSGDGYRVMTYAANAATGAATVDAAYLSDTTTTPQITLATENFSFASGTIISGHGTIVSPDYDDIAGNNYLWIVDIDDGHIYHSVKHLNSTDIPGLDAAAPTGLGIATMSEPDSSAVDSTGIVALADENALGLVLADFSAPVTFTPGTGGNPGTFSGEVYTVVPLDIPTRLTGIAMGGDHLLFMEEEFSQGIAVVQLPTSAPAGGTITVSSYNFASVPSADPTCAGVTSWANFGDPHGIGVYITAAGVATGALIDGNKDCAASVNLTSFLAATPGVGTHTVDNSTGFVSFDALTP
jgi:hypothetical protein